MKKLFRTLTKFSKVSDNKIIIRISTNSTGAHTVGGLERSHGKKMDFKTMNKSFHYNQTGGTLNHKTQQRSQSFDTTVKDSIYQTCRDRHYPIPGFGIIKWSHEKDNTRPIPHLSHYGKF